MHCTNCGKDNAPGKVFCTGCGNRLSPPQTADRICPRCGAVVAAQKNFCTQCGASVADNPSTTAQHHVGKSGMGTTAKVAIGSVATLGLIIACWLAISRSGLLSRLRPSGPHINVSRLALSNGRTDVIRPTSQANPMGLRAVSGFGNPDTGVPGLLTTIAAQPNPLMISLDLDKDGQIDGPANPIKADADGLLTCFSLLVAEDFPAEGTRWENIGARDSSGSFYATVNIPSANIFAGMELITDDELRAYTANSIIYEAPDYGVSPAAAINTKGAISVRAAPRPQPPTPRLNDLVEAPEMNFARDVRVEIEVVSTCPYPDGGLALTLKANLFGFDPVGDSHFRWAYDGNQVKFVKDEMANDQVTFSLPAEEKGQLVRLWVAVSSKGIGVGNPNPFVQNPPEQSVGTMTFVTAGSAVAAMTPYTVALKSKCGADEAHSNTPDDYGMKLRKTHITRQYASFDGVKTEEEVREGLPGPIHHTSRGVKVGRDWKAAWDDGYQVEATLTVDAPQSVEARKEFNVTATLDVNLNLSPESQFTGDCFKVSLGIGYARDKVKVENKTLTPGSVVTAGRYHLQTTVTGVLARGLGQETYHEITAEITTCYGYRDVIFVDFVYAFDLNGQQTGRKIFQSGHSVMAAKMMHPVDQRIQVPKLSELWRGFFSPADSSQYSSVTAARVKNPPHNLADTIIPTLCYAITTRDT